MAARRVKPARTGTAIAACGESGPAGLDGGGAPLHTPAARNLESAA